MMGQPVDFFIVWGQTKYGQKRHKNLLTLFECIFSGGWTMGQPAVSFISRTEVREDLS